MVSRILLHVPVHSHYACKERYRAGVSISIQQSGGGSFNTVPAALTRLSSDVCDARFVNRSTFTVTSLATETALTLSSRASQTKPCVRLFLSCNRRGECFTPRAFFAGGRQPRATDKNLSPRRRNYPKVAREDRLLPWEDSSLAREDPSLPWEDSSLPM